MQENYSQYGVYFRYNDFNPKHKSLVFIHGLSGCSSAWKFYEDYFKNDYNVLFFDLRGHGKSLKKKESDFYSLDAISQDIAEMTQKQGANKFFLVAHSFGVMPAINFATKFSHKVNGLITVGGFFNLNKNWREKLLRWILEISDFLGMPFFSERCGTEIDYSKFKYNSNWDWRRIYLDMKNTSIHVYYHYLIQAAKFSLGKFLNYLNMPILMIHGKNDSMIPATDLAKIANKVSNAQLKILDEANHLLIFNNSYQIVKEMECFLKTKPENNLIF